VEVKIIKSTFIPTVIKIKKGDTIRWVNTEELLHTVTSGKAPNPDKKFHAAYVKKEFEVTLDKAGFYDYFCELHQAVMRGVVIVRWRLAKAHEVICPIKRSKNTGPIFVGIGLGLTKPPTQLECSKSYYPSGARVMSLFTCLHAPWYFTLTFVPRRGSKGKSLGRISRVHWPHA